MKSSTNAIVKSLLFQHLNSPCCEGTLMKATLFLVSFLKARGELLILGNGRSTADSIFAGDELTKGFYCERKTTRVMYNQLCRMYGRKDANFYVQKFEREFSCISSPERTGFNSAYANDKGSGAIKFYSDVSIAVPFIETPLVQERHLPIFHSIRLSAKNDFFGRNQNDSHYRI